MKSASSTAMTLAISINSVIADFRENNVGKRQQKTTKHNILKNSDHLLALSTTYELEATQCCVFAFAGARNARCGHRPDSLPRTGSVPVSVRNTDSDAA